VRGILKSELGQGDLVSVAIVCSSWLGLGNLSARRRRAKQGPEQALAESDSNSTGSRAIAAAGSADWLYPDSLVAQIIAASTFHEQVNRGRPMGARAIRFEGGRWPKAVGPTTPHPPPPLGTRASRISLQFRPSWATWTKTPRRDVVLATRLLQPGTKE